MHGRGVEDGQMGAERPTPGQSRTRLIEHDDDCSPQEQWTLVVGDRITISLLYKNSLCDVDVAMVMRREKYIVIQTTINVNPTIRSDLGNRELSIAR